MIQGHRLPLLFDAPTPGNSFTDLLTTLGYSRSVEIPTEARPIRAPEGTTVLALRYEDGVVMIGDRQATEGNLVAHRSIRKVFPADQLSAVAIAGTAGLALEMVRLFQVELEHYEKIEGSRLSLEGKAAFLARLVRGQLPMVFQGLVVVPLFCGYDDRAGRGRLYTYDVIGGRYEENDFGATGSGGSLAKSFLRTAFREPIDAAEAVRIGISGLVAAAQEDTATGGPDLKRDILPTVLVIGADGVKELSDDEIRPAAESAVEAIR
ncbi:MAG: proteasome subunit beta [Actinomycetota bacterium]